MAQSYFSLTWDSFENNMCSKFTALQQTGDFVDLTLAADGQLVKVHQLILGVASPYIKELIHSAPCKHPIIFLNNVSFATLCSILQYVYTGEVAITEDQLSAFFQAAKALQIQGIGSGDLKCDMKESDCNETAPREENPGVQTIQIEVLDEISSHFEKVAVPITAKNIKVSGPAQKKPNVQKNPSQQAAVSPSRFSDADTSKEMEMSESSEIETVDEDFMENSRVTAKCSRNGSDEDFELSGLVDTAPSALPSSNELQYTVSIRGSLQLILNRYIYNLFSKSGGGKVRRWRCVDYKVQKCPACTVTNGDMVVKRINMHNHPYHDTKILGKIRKKAVYSAIKPIKNDIAVNT